MDHAQLTPIQSAALFVLLAESRELSNPELKEFGAALDKPARNHLNALTPDAIVALPGGPGTASEIDLAGRYGTPVAVHALSMG